MAPGVATANTFSTDVERCRTAGMNAHVGKPFRANELIVALGAALRGKVGFADGASESLRGSLETPVIDLVTLDEFRADSSEQALRLLIDTFLADAAKKLDQLVKVVGDNTATQEAVRLAHSLKGAGAMAGAMTLSRLAADMERALQSGDDTVTRSEVNEMTVQLDTYRNALIANGLLAA